MTAGVHRGPGTGRAHGGDQHQAHEAGHQGAEHCVTRHCHLMCSDHGISFLSSAEIATTLGLSAPNQRYIKECSQDLTLSFILLFLTIGVSKCIGTKKNKHFQFN